jgi:hypothetical protein
MTIIADILANNILYTKMVKIKENDRLRVNQAILAGEFERINEAALTAQRMAENLNIVDTLYKKYGEKIGIANRLMGLINNQ